MPACGSPPVRSPRASPRLLQKLVPAFAPREPEVRSPPFVTASVAPAAGLRPGSRGRPRRRRVLATAARRLGAVSGSARWRSPPRPLCPVRSSGARRVHGPRWSVPRRVAAARRPAVPADSTDMSAASPPFALRARPAGVLVGRPVLGWPLSCGPGRRRLRRSVGRSRCGRAVSARLASPVGRCAGVVAVPALRVLARFASRPPGFRLLSWWVSAGSALWGRLPAVLRGRLPVLGSSPAAHGRAAAALGRPVGRLACALWSVRPAPPRCGGLVAVRRYGLAASAPSPGSLWPSPPIILQGEGAPQALAAVGGRRVGVVYRVGARPRARLGAPRMSGPPGGSPRSARSAGVAVLRARGSRGAALSLDGVAPSPRESVRSAVVGCPWVCPIALPTVDGFRLSAAFGCGRLCPPRPRSWRKETAAQLSLPPRSWGASCTAGRELWVVPAPAAHAGRGVMAVSSTLRRRLRVASAHVLVSNVRPLPVSDYPR